MRKFIVIAGNNQALVKKSIQSRGNWEDITEERADGDFDNVHFIWKPTNLPIRAYAKMDSNPPSSESPQIFNHFEHNNGICTKTGLIRSLRTYYYSNEQALMHKYTVFESTPTTFLITAADENQEYVNFIARFRDITKRQFTKEHVPEKHCQENLWLIKPANQNQGRGIEIFNNLKDIQNFISCQTAHSYWVAQKYIEKPLLFYGRKFDIRQWVIVTNKLEIFFYRTAYMRTSSDTYKTDAFDNYIHLTNNCLQKHGENFGKFESGNTLPLDALQDYFDEMFPQHGLNLGKHIIPRMKDLIIDTILSVKKSLNPKRRKNCFELFGYDFLIDEDFRTWLLEVNTNPYLGVPNEFIKNLLPEMMDDLLKIVVDPIYPPTNPEAQCDRENKFELIYCEYHSSHHEGPLNVRSPFCDNLYPIPSIAPVLRHVRPAQGGDKENSKNLTREPRDLSVSNLLLKQQQPSDKDVHESVITKIKIKQDSTPANKKSKTGKATTIVLPDSVDVQRAPSPQSGREKRFSVGQQAQQQEKTEKAFNHNGIAETSKKIDTLLEAYTVLDNEVLMPLVLRLISSLTNWELQSNNEISTACKAITTISESKMCGALTDINCVTQMINLLDSQDVPLKIQVTLIKGFLNICKKISEKKKIVCDKMIHALIRITFACCDSVQIKNYDPQIIKLAIKCLGVLSGKYDRKMYVPGETLVQDKVRDFLINQGGILALLMASKLSLDEEIQNLPDHHCFRYLTISDWELQKTILETLKDEKGQIVLKDPAEEIDSKLKGNLSFLFSAASPGGPKLENKRLPDSTYYLGPVINPNIPKYLLERSDYTVENMTRDIEDKISTLKEEKKKLEQEEEERKEQFLQEQIKEQQQKESLALERKKRAEELFLKRLEERKKQQEEITKKIEEETKVRRQQEEDQRKMKMQELVKKKEEFEKKTKMMEVKKKKMEDEMKKLMEEEVEKKKAQRKALEESFWLRVKGKPKERPQEKDMHNMRKEDLMQVSMERATSVEPSMIQDNSSEKSKLLRTNTFGSPYNLGSEARSNTFSNFFKEEPLTKTTNSPANSIINDKGTRQRSVEEGRNRRKEKEKEPMVLPYIDIQSSQKVKSKISFEKMGKILKQSDLFTLNEAEEEATTFADDRLSNPLFKQLFKQPNTVRHEDGEKLKKMMVSSESIRPKNLVHLKEIVHDKLREKEQEKEKDKDKSKDMKEIIAKHKEASFGLRHISPQNLSEYAHTTMYKAYIGAKRKVKVQPAQPKNKEG